ncbi:MAG: tRNA 5-methoxyuridine(34)/uridine 5-oxyacetic acid(34) synthase CmoB [Porticoccaceae bacterium]|jgi:tRNA (mo5U34)-methyltransferase|nr:tRNA 5-methoxyuridine(34)/uridine 5-oxyacetic acid(34) synthase CmoB [Porticoccaceae bacterium]MDG1308789.1 tRNA 5-methoxyuridine(34)/uridine 5-oxyacetic acid(34) synthase CmoB [Porticoccaceae bacterium]
MIPKTLDYDQLFCWLEEHPLGDWGQTLPDLISYQLRPGRWGDMPEWEETLKRLPEIDPLHINLTNSVEIGDISLMDKGRRLALQATLMGLHPWRKGPFTLFGMPLDTEWRSDWKWNRVLPHLQPLQDRLILDVGCGNGYHCFRMLGAGAKRVIGIDPSPKFVFQFQAIKNFAGKQLPVDVLPIGIEHMPSKLAAFDTVFSMGILYHRRSPMDHLRELRELLRPGGQLVLETLVIDGPEGSTLVPEDRYAKMPNVWYLPSVNTLLSWMRKNGFKNPRVVDVNTTSIEEQRSTPWMTFESLEDFLDPNDSSKTIEGHPAPTRAVFLAEAP